MSRKVNLLRKLIFIKGLLLFGGLLSGLFLLTFSVRAATIAYVHGDVSEKGFTPSHTATSGATTPYDQMLLDDSGATGLSEFAQMVRQQGHDIDQHYDQATALTDAWLSDKDLVVFGLHQKLWSNAEKNALARWLSAGGGMIIYSDSASGGFHREVGAQNTVGQMVTNNLIADYGMQVTVDQADGVTSHTAASSTSISGISGKTLQGEGVSPIALGANSSLVDVLIPYNRTVNKTQNITIDNPVYAALALRSVGDGHIAVMFDRQPMWNSGPGSDISKLHNRDILRSLINFLAQQASQASPPASAMMHSKAEITAAILLLLAD